MNDYEDYPDEDYPRNTLPYKKAWHWYCAYSDTANYFFDTKQYKEWLDKNAEDALKKYFKKVLKVIDDVQEKIDEVKQLYGDESYADKIIRDLKSKAYDDLEELLVQLAVEPLWEDLI